MYNLKVHCFKHLVFLHSFNEHWFFWEYNQCKLNKAVLLCFVEIFIRGVFIIKEGKKREGERERERETEKETEKEGEKEKEESHHQWQFQLQHLICQYHCVAVAYKYVTKTVKT